jgi:hypothetical protein
MLRNRLFANRRMSRRENARLLIFALVWVVAGVATQSASRSSLVQAVGLAVVVGILLSCPPAAESFDWRKKSRQHELQREQNANYH